MIPISGMKISEMTDCTIVLENYHGIWDFMAMSEDYQENGKLLIFKPNSSFEMYRPADVLFSTDIIVLYFTKVPEDFHLGDIVGLKIGQDWYEYNYENSRTK